MITADQNTVNPSINRTTIFKRIPALPSLQQSFLEQILSLMMVPRQETGGAIELGLVRPHRRGKITVGRGHGDVTRHALSAIRNDRAHLKCGGRQRTKTQHVSSFSLGAYSRWKGSIFFLAVVTRRKMRSWKR